jgi:hypothetical protein
MPIDVVSTIDECPLRNCLPIEQRTWLYISIAALFMICHIYGPVKKPRVWLRLKRSNLRMLFEIESSANRIDPDRTTFAILLADQPELHKCHNSDCKSSKSESISLKVRIKISVNTMPMALSVQQ